MKIFNKSYHDQILERIVQRVPSLKKQIESVSEGRTMPDPDDVRIGSGKCMELAVMFIDICDFTSRGSDRRAEQENVLIMLNMFISEMIAIIRDYGGVVEKNTGDGLMAYFGTESSDSTAITLDAVSSFLTMHYVAEYMINPILVRMRIKPISFRIGIDQGYVMIARIGVPNMNTLTAVGATPNIACRLLNLAGPNETYIGNDVFLNLPKGWRYFCNQIYGKSTRYIYTYSGLRYPIWEYIGRWGKPII